MEKAIKINIGNDIFHIEEDAYHKLKDYIDQLTAYYSSYEEGVEIMSDIEQRVSEIFKERGRSLEVAVTMSDIEYVISVLGKPEEITGEDIMDEEPVQTSSGYKRNKRMYRDPDNIVIGGVSGGLGAYFGIDPVILRILFVLAGFAYFTGVIAYFILWIAVPLARTRAEKLEMRGHNVNVSNIDKSIKEEVDNVKENFNKMRSSAKFKRFREMFDNVVNFLALALTIIFKVAILILGISIIIAAVSLLFAFLAFLVTGLGLSHTIPDIIAMYATPDGAATVLVVSLVLLVVLPLIALIYGGAKIAFKFKSNNKLIWFGLLGVWIIALFVFMFNSMQFLKEFTVRNEISEEYVLKEFNNDTLFLDVEKSNVKFFSTYGYIGKMKIGTIDNTDKLVGKPVLDVKQSSDENFRLVVYKNSKGKSMKVARSNAALVEYKFEQKDSLLLFEPYFTLAEGTRWLDQKIHATLYVPVGKIIYLGEKTGKIIYDIKNIHDTYDADMLGHYWIMTKDGLAALHPEKVKYGYHYKRTTYFDSIEELENELVKLKEELEFTKEEALRSKKIKYKYRKDKRSEEYIENAKRYKFLLSKQKKLYKETKRLKKKIEKIKREDDNVKVDISSKGIRIEVEDDKGNKSKIKIDEESGVQIQVKEEDEE